MRDLITTILVLFIIGFPLLNTALGSSNHVENRQIEELHSEFKQTCSNLLSLGGSLEGEDYRSSNRTLEICRAFETNLNFVLVLTYILEVAPKGLEVNDRLVSSADHFLQVLVDSLDYPREMVSQTIATASSPGFVAELRDLRGLLNQVESLKGKSVASDSSRQPDVGDSSKYATSSDANQAIAGVGAMPCDEYVYYRSGPDTKEIDFSTLNWVLGYFSALNLFYIANDLDGQTVDLSNHDEIQRRLIGYCHEHPKDSINVSTWALWGRLRSDQGLPTDPRFIPK